MVMPLEPAGDLGYAGGVMVMPLEPAGDLLQSTFARSRELVELLSCEMLAVGGVAWG